VVADYGAPLFIQHASLFFIVLVPVFIAGVSNNGVSDYGVYVLVRMGSAPRGNQQEADYFPLGHLQSAPDRRNFVSIQSDYQFSCGCQFYFHATHTLIDYRWKADPNLQDESIHCNGSSHINEFRVFFWIYYESCVAE